MFLHACSSVEEKCSYKNGEKITRGTGDPIDRRNWVENGTCNERSRVNWQCRSCVSIWQCGVLLGSERDPRFWQIIVLLVSQDWTCLIEVPWICACPSSTARLTSVGFSD